MKPFGIIWLLVVLWTQPAWPQTTNRYSTDDLAYAVDPTLRHYRTAPMTPPEAIASLPAEAAPPGHWGGVVGGRQLSLWFEQSGWIADREHPGWMPYHPQPAFLVGQPIVAYVLARNLDTDPQSFGFGDTDPALGFTLCVTNSGQPAPYTPAWAKWLKQPDYETTGSSELGIPRGSQRLFRFQLDAFYDFSTPGEYEVTIKRPASAPPGWVSSATVRFHVYKLPQQEEAPRKEAPKPDSGK
jgi:hypothetical protein